MSFSFYSYPKYSGFALLDSNDTELHNASKYLMSIEEAEVTTTFYEKSVTLTGHILNFTIIDLVQSDFANYSLQVRNEIGPTDMAFSVIADSKYI